MKKILLSFLTLALISSVSGVFAADLKIGVVNFQQVLQNYPKVKATDEKLKKQFAPQQEKLVAMQKKLNDDINKYNRDGAIMKESDKKDAEGKIRDAANKFQTAQGDFQKQLALARNEAMKSIEQDVSGIVSKVAKEQNFDLVLAKAAVGYNKPEADITDRVIKKLK
jgi:outer membrane protein